MLKIKNLTAQLEEGAKPILKGVTLTIQPGEVHALMGPNGAGKSTFGNVLAGREGYEVTAGTATLGGMDLLDMEADERARTGVFLAFQYPVELPGVNVAQFLRTSLNAHRVARGEKEMDAVTFLKRAREEMKALGMAENFLQRSVNVGFSGGEKKRFEMLQLALLEPSLAILDETDSGLDIDALKVLAEAVNRIRSHGKTMFLVITHYQRLLEDIKPDHVHIFANGVIQKSGDASLAVQLEQQGYEGILKN